MANVAKQLNTFSEKLSFGDCLPKLKDGDIYGLHEYGNTILSNVDYISEFTGAWFKIAFSVIESQVWENPFKFFFKKFDYGTAVEDVFINIARAQKYDPFGDGSTVWQRTMPDVRSKLHLLNVDFTVEQTVYENQLYQAFNSYDSMNSWWTGVIRAINDGISFTIFECCRYMMALSALDNGTPTLYLDEADPKKTVKSLKALSGRMKTLSPLYNRAGVMTSSQRKDLYLFITPEMNADLEVEVLAYMFNEEIGKVNFHVMEVNDFFDFDYNTLGNAFPNGLPHVFTEEELEKLRKVPGMLCDRDYLFFYNFKYRQNCLFNQKQGNWNLCTRWMGMVSTSPFRTNVLLSYGDKVEATKIVNPYGDDNLRVGRRNLFYVYPAKLDSFSTDSKMLSGEVSGAALVPVEDRPGWYQASGQKGDRATITYTSANPSLTLTVNVVTI